MKLLNQIKNNLQDLAHKTSKTKTSNHFKSYLNTMSKFWNYSHNNQLLIHHQSPNATKVAGYQTWKKLKRKVKKKEKAIKILAPILIKKEDKETIYFKPVSVFDISQTEGEPLPEIDIDIQGSNHNILNKLINYCNNNNIALEFKNLKQNLYGYSKGGYIAINSTKSINTQINTLIHEIAHEILHKDTKVSKQEKEIQAEAVAYVVCKTLGLEAKSFNYLALYGADAKKIMKNLEVVSRCVKDIIRNI